jgi:hypothetical protein
MYVTDVLGKDPESVVGVTGFEPATRTSRRARINLGEEEV